MSTGTQDAFLRSGGDFMENGAGLARGERKQDVILFYGKMRTKKVEKVLPSRSGDCRRKGVDPSIFSLGGNKAQSRAVIHSRNTAAG